jgi:hypothetical protein
LETCMSTGKRVLRDRLVRSNVSGHYLLAEAAVRSAISGKVCAAKEAVLCQWLDQQLLPEDVGVCHRTGLTFAKIFLNPQGEFTILRQMLDGRMAGLDRPELIAWLKQQRPDVFGNLRACCKINGRHLPPLRQVARFSLRKARFL